MYQRGEFLYEGKAKKLYKVQSHDDLIWVEFKDSLTAFNAEKKGQFSDKGLINSKISYSIFKFLAEQNIKTHLVELVESQVWVTKKLDMIPLEVVVRNQVAGSLAKKFNLPKGKKLKKPLLEFYYKSDELQDPFVSAEQIECLELYSNLGVLSELKSLGLKVNEALLSFFKKIDLDLIDFKLEFGVNEAGEIVLGDEISPDSCRLWDSKTGDNLDKDRFRYDQGKVEESYKEVLSRIERVYP